uniref:hypothetical protein n=1 Tax=Dubosiella newyorkensis TaxID=1862672 RepID=UPI00272A5920
AVAPVCQLGHLCGALFCGILAPGPEWASGWHFHDTAKTAAKTAAESATLTAVNGTKAQISAAINEQVCTFLT